MNIFINIRWIFIDIRESLIKQNSNRKRTELNI